MTKYLIRKQHRYMDKQVTDIHMHFNAFAMDVYKHLVETKMYHVWLYQDGKLIETNTND